MKILKKAEQKNFRVDMSFYRDYELEELEEQGEISGSLFYGEKNYVVFTSNCKEVKVICHNGYYTNVVVTNSGKQIFIEI